MYKTKIPQKDLREKSWARRIRTFEVTESESVALPLGDSPMYCFLPASLGDKKYYMTEQNEMQVFF